MAAATLLVSAARGAAAPAVESAGGMVVSAQHLASDAGAAVLRAGGNAIDAAVAVGYALAVTHPCCGNLGGGGFMLIHLADGRDTFLNFREKAPLAATANMYLDSHGEPIAARSIDGYLAVGVPGTVMGLETARERYGTLPRATLLAPAIALARDGFILTRGDTDVLDGATREFRAQPNVAAVFLNHGAPFRPGERLVQTELASTLRAISAGGVDAFYRGPIAASVAAASRANGGLLTPGDFAAYTVTESPPIRCSYRGYSRFIGAPAELGRRHPLRDAADPAGLSAERARLSLEPLRALPHGGHAPCLSRPEPLLGRPGLHRQSRRTIDFAGLCRRDPRPHRAGSRNPVRLARHGGGGASRRPPPLTIRWWIPRATPWR